MRPVEHSVISVWPLRICSRIIRVQSVIIPEASLHGSLQRESAAHGIASGKTVIDLDRFLIVMTWHAKLATQIRRYARLNGKRNPGGIQEETGDRIDAGRRNYIARKGLPDKPVRTVRIR